MQQLDLALDFSEPNAYHDMTREGFFALLMQQDRGKIQQSYELSKLPFVIDHLDKTKDSWISQAEFYCKTRRIVHLLRLGLLFVDLDTYHIPHMKGMNPDQQVAALLHWCDEEGIPYPSLVIFSGRGLQAKWLLDGTLPRKALPRWNAAQRYLVEGMLPIGADPAAKDASRVLRLEHTINTKSGEMVHVVHVTEENGEPIRYNFEYLCECVLPKARWDIEKKKKKKPKLKGIEGGYTKGLRRSSDRRLNWDRLEDLRKLGQLRGGVVEGERMKSLLWRLNFLLLSGATHSSLMFHEAKALAKEIDPRWNSQLSELSTLYRKAKAFNAGEKIELNGKKYPALYTPKNQHLIDLFSITDDEQRQLQTIITPAMAKDRRNERDRKRHEEKRRKAGAVKRAEYEAPAERNRAQAKKLKLEGLTIRAIADRLGVSKSQVGRYLTSCP
jgi:hypothetical protein